MIEGLVTYEINAIEINLKLTCSIIVIKKINCNLNAIVFYNPKIGNRKGNHNLIFTNRQLFIICFWKLKKS